MSPAAFHDSGERRNPPNCYPNTRVAVQKKIMDWIRGLDPDTRNHLVMWIHGAAGAGKSAIAQTIAELCSDQGILLASYFFSRFDPTRNQSRSLIATIAYQAISHFPAMRNLVVDAIDMDPLVFTRSLSSQMSSIIVKPLQHLISSGYLVDNSRRLVIIDGLDECEDKDDQKDILRTISDTLQQHSQLPLSFLITSRLDPNINYTFRSLYSNSVVARLPLDDRYKPSSDIRLFLGAKFTNIAENHPFKARIPSGWPSSEALDFLVQNSSGQFIYAATVVRFIESPRHQPHNRLDIVLGLRPKGRDMPFAELDALYHQIFSSIENIEAVLQILSFVILSRPYKFSADSLEQIFSLEPGEIETLLYDIASVVDVRHGDEGITFLHASLEDFLLDQARSEDLFIDAYVRHAQFCDILIQKSSKYIINFLRA